MEMTLEQQRAMALARARVRAAQASDQSYSGTILPFSKNAQGEVSFDSNAGILGDIKRAFTAPGRAMSGELQVMAPDGRASPEAIAEGFNFAGLANPVTPELRAGGYLIPGEKQALQRAKVEPPSQDMLRDTARRSYDELRDLGVDYSTASVNQMAGEIQAQLTQDGIIGTLAPKTYSVLEQLSASPEGSVASVNGLTAARKAFRNAANDFANPTEQLAAQRAIESVDGFLTRSDPASVVRGDASQVGPLLRDANANYGAYKRSEKLTDLTDAAQLRANAANSGANSGNTTRQRLASLILNGRGKEVAGFSLEEVSGLRAVNAGSAAANTTRYVGNLLGGGGGLGAAVTGGLAGSGAAIATGNPLMSLAGLAAPVAGALSKKTSNMLTERALKAVDAGVRKRSPLYEEMVKNAPMVRKDRKLTAASIRAMILGLPEGAGAQ